MVYTVCYGYVRVLLQYTISTKTLHYTVKNADPTWDVEHPMWDVTGPNLTWDVYHLTWDVDYPTRDNLKRTFHLR